MSRRIYSALIAFVLASLASYWAYTSVQFTVQEIAIKAQTQQASTVVLSDIDASGKRTMLAELPLYGGNGAMVQLPTTSGLVKPVRRLEVSFRTDDSEQSNAVIFHGLSIAPVYSGDARYIPTQEVFQVQDFTPHSNNYYELEAGEALVFTTAQNLLPEKLLLVVFVAGLLFIVFYCSLLMIQWGQIPAIRDMQLGELVSTQKEFATINGLRGLAAVLVLLSHSAPGWANLQLGIGILFLLSGYLLTRPFTLNQGKIFSMAEIETFWLKRIKRILPMYFFFVFLSYGLSLELETLARHLLFIEAGGHLWPMTQIFVFYLLLPFIWIITARANSYSNWAPLLLLAVGASVWYALFEDWRPFFNGVYHHQFYLDVFMLGVFAAYLQTNVISKWSFSFSNSRALIWLGGMLALVFFALLILWSGPLRTMAPVRELTSLFIVKCLGCMFLILIVVNNQDSPLARLLRNPLFQSVGIAGFSFYLLHGFGVDLFAQILSAVSEFDSSIERSWVLSAGGFVLTYLMALLTYSYIERPFFGRDRTLKKLKNEP
ncbi:MAG: acyltransferase [Pseudomonadota bacterium]